MDGARRACEQISVYQTQKKKKKKGGGGDMCTKRGPRYLPTNSSKKHLVFKNVFSAHLNVVSHQWAC
eukprot:SAG11_NODE_1929_length_4049_cov_7.874430_1_plen_67_part_00